MKNDLIDRKELYNQIRLYLNRHSLGETTAQTTLTIGEIASIIADIPTVDTVRHGKWEGLRCSECGRVSWSNTNYCQHCGATMDGEMSK